MEVPETSGSTYGYLEANTEGLEPFESYGAWMCGPCKALESFFELRKVPGGLTAI